MSQLSHQRQRLYGLPSTTADLPTDAPALTRALVLEVGGPADWDLLGVVWRGVQADLALPAPAIAASGSDGLQLWFSLAEPVTPAAGRAWLDGLCRHYLPPGLPARRVRLWPTAEGRQAPVVPALVDAASGHWSAFVAPDLAPLFAETPCLDIPPGDEAQAQRLAGLQSITPQAWHAACAQLQALLQPPPAPAAPHAAMPLPPSAAAHRLDTSRSAGYTDPRAFLLAVMNDDSAPLALRIEAAKALLAAAP